MNNLIIMDLQLFAEEKTEKATPKKRKEARERGQVFRSIELNSAIVLLIGFGALKLASLFVLDKLQTLYTKYLTIQGSMDEIYSYPGLSQMNRELLTTLGLIIAPIVGLIMIAGLIVNYCQVGFVFTSKAISPNLNRLNPIEGLKRIFSKRAMAEFIKSLLKLGLVSSIVYWDLIANIEILPNLVKWDIMKSLSFVLNRAFNIGIKMALCLLILAIFDFFYQWWDYEKSLRMTKQELKDEYKQVEGDPLVRSKIRERQRQLGMLRMMQEIPKADVVITNPVHFAVALRYNPDEHDSPVVVAKGRDYVALKIKEIANKNHVAVVENKPLAQALYSSTEIGQTIPPELFHAVAEVLAFVYNLKGKQI